MSRSRIVGIVALIVFAVGIVLVGNAVAGEKNRLSTVYHTIKFEQLNVPGEEGHGIALSEMKGIVRNKDGKRFGEGVIIHTVCHGDLNMKAGMWSGHCFDEWIDREGDKIYSDGEGKGFKTGEMGPYLEGMNTFTRGTGKYEGMRGRFNWKAYYVSQDQCYADWDVEVELSR